MGIWAFDRPDVEYKMLNTLIRTRMSGKFLLKTFILVAALAAVAAAIYVLAGGSFWFDSDRAGRTPTFFEQFVVAGGPIVWFVLLPLSLIMVYLAAEHFLTIRRRRLLPDAAAPSIAGLIQQFGLGQLEHRLAGRNDLAGIAAVKAVSTGRGDWFRMRNLLAESLQDQAAALLRRIEWLNLIGNVSPMVGLFGTVYGMIKLFNAIVLAGGQPLPAQLADGISVALVTTFWGLFIAIPALAIHGVLRNRIEHLVNDAVVQAEDIAAEIRQGLERQKQGQSLPSVRMKQPIREVAGRPIEKNSKVKM